MATIVELHPSAHHYWYLDTNKIVQHGKALNLIPVVIDEIRQLIIDYPVVITKRQDTGEFMLSALTGFSEGENLFFEQEAWNSLYIPLQVQRQPFFVSPVSEQENSVLPRLVMTIDEDSPALIKDYNNADSLPQIQPLFNNDGSDGEVLTSAKQHLATIYKGESKTRQFITTLLELDLIESLQLDIEFIDGSSVSVNGLYTIKEPQWQALDAQALHSLFRQGFVNVIEAMILSQAHLYRLIDLKNSRVSDDNVC